MEVMILTLLPWMIPGIMLTTMNVTMWMMMLTLNRHECDNSDDLKLMTMNFDGADVDK